MTRSFTRLFGLFIVLTIAVVAVAANGNEKKSEKRSAKTGVITAVPMGVSEKDVFAAKRRVIESRELRSTMSSSKYRLVAFQMIERAGRNKESLVPTHFRAFYYDYIASRTVAAEGDFAGKERIRVSDTDFEPSVKATQEEVAAAFEIVKANPKYGELYRKGELELFAPMPPLFYKNGERLINVGFKRADAPADEIVGVSFKNDNVVVYQKGDGPERSDQLGNCGQSNSGQGSSSSGTGQLALTMQVEGANLWEMTVLRPAMSSGRAGEGSGIEVRDVKYKGKSVLKRGHAPVLNVKYHPGGCGSFRDWQDAEGWFDAPSAGAQDPLPGYRILATAEKATTVVESSNDTGNFQGVAIYQENTNFGLEFVLVTEMNAGWYRYIMEWRFAEDGTIRPRYGFGSVTNSCVCRARNHHVYWRFDFDVVQPNNDVYKVERGRRFLSPITEEASMFRNYQRNRSILIQNSAGNEAYQLTPNITDEEAYNLEGSTLQTYGAGDLWIMQFKGTSGSPDELNDPNTSSAANLDPWVNGESLGGNDVVVWYGAHQYRDDASSLTNYDRSGLVLGGVHTVGPDLRPVRW